MARQSCINHPSNDTYVKRRKDYVAICDGNTCAAELLDLFEYWTNCKLERVREVEAFNETAVKLGQPTIPIPNTWLYERIQDLKAALIEGFAETSIKRSLGLLKRKGFIEDKPSPTKFDNTKLYMFCVANVQSAIDNWHRQAKAESTEKSEETKITDDQSKVSLDETILSLDESKVSLDETKTSDISNTLSNTLSEIPSKTHFPPTPQGEKEDVCEEKTASPEENSSTADTGFVVKTKQTLSSTEQANSGNIGFAALCDNNAFMGHGNLAPDGKQRTFNQITGKWASASSDPWMNGCNPVREFKQWVYKRAIAKGKVYSEADASGEIRNNYQRAMDLWEEYQAAQKPPDSGTPQHTFAPDTLLQPRKPIKLARRR